MTETSSPPEGRNDDAKIAGRGFLVISGAKLWFMVGGTLITFGLPVIFARFSADGPALYGQYYDLNNLLSIFSMVMVTGVMQTVSKFVSEQPEQPQEIVHRARKMMMLVGGIIASGFFWAAPEIAILRNNPELTDGYRAAGVILFAYGIYTVYIGTLNGQKRFLNQAVFDIGFTTLKAGLVLGLAALGLGVLGAFYGFATAAVVIAICAIFWVSRKISGLSFRLDELIWLTAGLSLGYLASLLSVDNLQPALKWGTAACLLSGVLFCRWRYRDEMHPLYVFAEKVMLYTLVFNLVFKLDAVLIKSAMVELYATQAGWTHGLGEVIVWLNGQAIETQVQVRAQADALMANYGMAVNVSRVPWQATIAITFVVFPLMSAATFANDQAKTQAYIRQTLRYSTILVASAAVVLVSIPDAIFTVLPSGYEMGAVALIWLAPAYFSFSLFNIVNTLLMSADRAGSALMISLITVVLAGASYLVILPLASDPTELLTWAAMTTFGAFSVGLSLGLILLGRLFGASIPAMTAGRVFMSGALLVAVGSLMPDAGRILSLLFAIGIGISFLVCVGLLGEFTRDDKDKLLAMIGRDQ